MVYYHAQHPCKRARNTSFTISGLAPCGSTPPFPCDSISPCSNDFARSDSCDFFDFFDFLILLPTMDLSLPSAYSFRFRPLLVARYALSEAPEPLIISVLCGCCRLYRCRQILTSGEEILALCSSATSQYLLLPTTTNAADVMQLPMIDGMQD